MTVTPVSNCANRPEVGCFIINERFKILEKLGKGGMGEIFLAEDVKLKRKVAVKKITTKDLLDESAKSRFLREAQTTSRIEHINICTVYEIYEQDEGDYIVMQYVDGVSLDQVVKYKKLRIEKILDIGLQVCKGMMEAHSKKVIHRDLKPGNIMIDNRGVVKILDFGLAKMKDRATATEEGIADTQLTEKGLVMGTVAYMSPEQVRGGVLDTRTDIFSFGCVLFEMLEGTDPFHDTEQINILYNVLNHEVKFKRKVPARLRSIILRALAKDKEDRYKDFSELRDELEDFRLSYLGIKTGNEKGDYKRLSALIKKGKVWQENYSSSGGEDLDQMVLRLKNIQDDQLPASYQSTFGKKRMRITFFLLFLVAVSATYFFLGQKLGFPGLQSDVSYILLRNFKNETAEKELPAMINYLMYISLNQSTNVKTVRENELPVSAGTGNDRKLAGYFEERFPFSYEITGNISNIKDIINIDAVLKPYNSTGRSFSITIPGLQDHDSLLIHQIDTLSKKIFLQLEEFKSEDIDGFKKISWLFGSSWAKFVVFYQGFEYYRRMEFSMALQYFSQVRDLVAAKLYLADLYSQATFKIKAETLLNEIIPEIERLPDIFKLRTFSLQSRINFEFAREINYLRLLKDYIPFSKDVTFEIAESFFRRALHDKAIPYYRETLQLQPDHSRAINHLAYCYSFLGWHKEAIDLFERYRDLDRTANSFDSLGDGYFYAGDYISAEACKKAAVSLEDEGIFWSYQSLANIAIMKAKFNEAANYIDQFDRVVVPNLSAARGYSDMKRAYIYFLKEDYPEALIQVDSSIHIFDASGADTASALSHWLKGRILLKQDKLEGCRDELTWLEKFRDKYRLSEENYSTPYKFMLHLKACILEREGYHEKAGDVFRNLVSLKSRLSQASTYFHSQYFHAEYSAFLARTGKYNQGLEEVNRCLDFNPNYIPALWIKANILEKLRQEGAVQIYDQISDLYGDSSETNAFRTKLNTAVSKK